MSVSLANQVVCEVEFSSVQTKVQADWPVHFDTCGRGHLLEPTETDRHKLAVKKVYNKALKITLSNSV